MTMIQIPNGDLPRIECDWCGCGLEPDSDYLTPHEDGCPNERSHETDEWLIDCDCDLHMCIDCAVSQKERESYDEMRKSVLRSSDL